MSVEKTLEELVPSIDWSTYYPFYQLLSEFVPIILGFMLFMYSVLYTYRAFKNHTYYDIVTYSLNGFQPFQEVPERKDLLAFRTQMECRLNDLFPENKRLLKDIKRAAKRCNTHNVFMLIDDDYRTQEIFLNGISSHWIAQESADGDLAREMGLPIKECDFWIGVTFEPYELPPIRKIRVMIISDDEIRYRNLKKNFEFENESHQDRIHTLLIMQKLYNVPEDREKYLIQRTVTKRI